MEDMNNFARNLEAAMYERQVNQKELATAIGKGKTSVCYYLSGRSVPRPDVQEKIAAYLDCTVEWLNSEPVSDSTVKGLRNVPVAQCAKLLGKPEQFIRLSLQKGTAPFGFAVHGKRWAYHISPKKLSEYIDTGGAL